MKILVCGKAPCLLDQLKDRDLSEYFVVRVNNWLPIEGYDNKCDAWAFYPLHIPQGIRFKEQNIWMRDNPIGNACPRDDIATIACLPHAAAFIYIAIG